jgi:hypothetical protein
VSAWFLVGVSLIATGAVELALFQWLAPRHPNIARRMPLLMANSAFNVALGLGALAWERFGATHAG